MRLNAFGTARAKAVLSLRPVAPVAGFGLGGRDCLKRFRSSLLHLVAGFLAVFTESSGVNTRAP